MSQKKIDARKKSKGDMLHDAKKQARITVAVVAGVLIVLGALVSVITYHSGYDKGNGTGYKTGFEDGSALESFYQYLNESKEQASKNQATTASKDQTTSAKDETTTATQEETTTAAEK